MRAKAIASVLLCGSIQLPWPATTSAADAPCRNDILIGQDETRYYCLPRRVVEGCKATVAPTDLDKCIKAGCVGGAGNKLKKQQSICIEKNEACLEDKGVEAALISSITTCLVGLATPAPGATCFAAGLGGAAIHDVAADVCKKRFGDCMEPPLEEHRNHVKYCASKMPI